MTGPLAGVKVVQLGGIGPVPFCGMMLSDLGADVVVIHRTGEAGSASLPVIDRGRRSLAVDLKQPEGVAVVRRLIDEADAVIEGFRPGVAERLGFDPVELRKTNPRLVFGRMTGFGQDGPLAQAAGHDIDYIALSGVLGAIGRKGEAPVPPLNLVGDFGGGAMFLAVGVLAGILSARATGEGQDIDAAMVDGSALLTAMQWGFAAHGIWNLQERGVNWLDTGSHWYDTYRCADGQYLALGALEPQFYAELVKGLGLDVDLGKQMDPASEAATRELFAATIATKTRDEWVKTFEGLDACVAPVLTMAEAPTHPHNIARGTFVEDSAGTTQPAPAPRFSGTPLAAPEPAGVRGAQTGEILAELGYSAAEIEQLREAGAVA